MTGITGKCGKLALATSLLIAGALIAPGTAAAAPGTPAAAAAETAAPAVDAAGIAAEYVAAHPKSVQLGAHDTLVPGTPIVGGNGLTFIPYQRSYRGLPVIGGDFVVVVNTAGTVVSVQVAQTAPLGTISTTPTVSADSARGKALGRLKIAARAKPATVAPGARLVVLAGSPAKLAWESIVSGQTDDGASRLAVYVDANSGAVLAQQEKIMHATGTGTGAYSGPNPLTLDTSGSGTSYTMTDPTRSGLSCQDASTYRVFSGTDNAWGNGDPKNRETGCVDALFAAQTQWKMLASWLGRNGFDGAGHGWPVRVGLADINAFYDGSQVQIGHNTAGAWISSIDVVAHEFGHGIDDHTPGGISGSGTQEFVADTFGAATEWYSQQPAPYDVPDYTVGEEVNLTGNGPIRVMYNPAAVGDKNCYDSSIPTAEVHAAAGPGNHWFYLLAEGSNPTNGQPTSPTCNGSSVSGLGIQKAITIMYNAMLMKTSGANYLKYRVWTLTAAKNLYPASCTEFNAVKAAWNAVSVPAQTGEPTCGGTSTLAVTNPGNQSTAVGTAVSLQLAATGGSTPYTWTASGLPAGLAVSSTGKITGSPTTAGTSSVTVTAKDAAGATASASFSWAVTSGGGGSCSGQLLINPGFESGATGWTGTAGVVTNDSGAAARTGTWKAWLDGYGQSHTDSVAQTVTVPSGCTATLTYYLWIDSDEGTSSAYDKLTVSVNGVSKQTYSNVNKGTGYVKRTLSLTGYSGSVTIKFTGVEDSYLATSFLIDDTALTLS